MKIFDLLNTMRRVPQYVGVHGPGLVLEHTAWTDWHAMPKDVLKATVMTWWIDNEMHELRIAVHPATAAKLLEEYKVGENVQQIIPIAHNKKELKL